MVCVIIGESIISECQDDPCMYAAEEKLLKKLNQLTYLLTYLVSRSFAVK